MEQTPSWENNISSACQDISLILCNPKVFTSSISAQHPSLSSARSIQSTSTVSHFSKFQFTAIFPFRPRSSKRSPFLTPPHQNPIWFALRCTAEERSLYLTFSISLLRLSSEAQISKNSMFLNNINYKTASVCRGIPWPSKSVVKVWGIHNRPTWMLGWVLRI